MYRLAAAVGPTLYVAAVKSGQIKSLTLNIIIIPLILVGSSSSASFHTFMWGRCVL